MPIAHTVAQSMRNHAPRRVRTLKELRQLQSHRAACELLIIESGCTEPTPSRLRQAIDRAAARLAIYIWPARLHHWSHQSSLHTEAKLDVLLDCPGATNMTHPTPHLSTARGAIAAVALSLGLVGNGMAQGYDFNRLVPGGGGGGGTDPAKRSIVAARGQYICLAVKQGPGNQVVFTIWSMIPEPNAQLQRINFDTGNKYPDLITGLKVTFTSPVIKSQVAASRGSGRRFEVYLPYDYSKGRRPGGGLKPGGIIMLSAELGPGQTYSNLVRALQQGLNPATETHGLRIWVSGHSFLGGPPPGVATISDDATFALRGAAPQCQR